MITTTTAPNGLPKENARTTPGTCSLTARSLAISATPPLPSPPALTSSPAVALGKTTDGAPETHPTWAPTVRSLVETAMVLLQAPVVTRSRFPSTTSLNDLPAKELSRVVSKQLSLPPASSTWPTLSSIPTATPTSQDHPAATPGVANTALLSVTGT